MINGLKSDKEYKKMIENNFYKHIGYEYVENLSKELEAEKAEWEDIQIPDGLNHWFHEFQKREETKVKKKGKPSYRLLKKVAVILLFLVGFNYILIVNVDAYRYGLLNSFINIQNKFTKIDIDKQDATVKANVPKDWSGWYYMTYWPSGYYLDSSIADNAWSILTFMNEEGNYINLQQNMMVSSQHIDSEDGKVTTFEVNGVEALYAEKNEIKMLSWIQDDRAFYLEANASSTKELLKIAENIKKMK